MQTAAIFLKIVTMTRYLADSIDYYRIYGMNTTIIRICDRQDTAGSA